MLQILILIAAIYIFVLIANITSQKNYLKNLQSLVNKKYAKEETDYILTEKEIRELYDLEKSGIDEITFKDLELFRVFKKLNHTDSTMGAQYLYKMLREQHYDFDFHNNLKNKIEELSQGDELTKSIKLEFAKFGFLKKSLVQFFKNSKSSHTEYQMLSRIFRFTPIVLLGLVFYDKSLALLAAPFLLGMNAYVDFKVRKKTAGIFNSVGKMNEMFELSSFIENLNLKSIDEEIREIKYLNESLKELSKKSKKIRLVYGMDEAAGVERSLDILFLSSANRFFNISNELEQKRDEVLKLYTLLGKINAYTSIVSYKKASSAIFVDFKENTTLKAKELAHPLLDEQVTQNFDFSLENVLLTGSNASGKSTFLRNLGIAVTLSNSIGIAHASEFETSFFMLESAIDISDSLSEKMSYFMAETTAIKRMMEESKVQKLLILDEIFKGTNTIDRIASAYSTLKYMAKSSKVVVATHDIELTELLKDYTNYHFEENIRENDIEFDYILKDGRTNSKNAIEILKLKGYPKVITDEAYEMSKKLEEK